nr:hypothetical protein [Rhizobium sp. P28RR-XV]
MLPSHFGSAALLAWLQRAGTMKVDFMEMQVGKFGVDPRSDTLGNRMNSASCDW